VKRAAASNAVTCIPGLPAKPYGETGIPSITVPTGRHLVIETVSVQIDVSPSGTRTEAFVNYVCAGNNVSLFVPVTYAYTDPGSGYDFYVGMQQVRLYADPGTLVSVSAASLGGVSGTLFLTVSGYLI
jgi:hypothetical protein